MKSVQNMTLAELRVYFRDYTKDDLLLKIKQLSAKQLSAKIPKKFTCPKCKRNEYLLSQKQKTVWCDHGDCSFSCSTIELEDYME